MKKILSLLVLLVMTLTASAYEFTDSRVVTFGLKGDTNANDAKLTVTDNGNGTYNVEFQDIIVQDGSYTDNYGTFVFENVPGTSDGTLTTISGSGNQGKVKPRDYTAISFTYEWNLTVKFNDSKAYAKVATSLPVYGSTDFTVVFGTDDFGSTGGGTTPDPTVEDTKQFTENWVSSPGGTGIADVTILTYSDDKITMSTNIEGCDITADDLTKGEDAQGRVTYIGKAKNQTNDVIYDVVAVVYGDEAQPRIYMTLTTEWKFAYTIGENPDLIPTTQNFNEAWVNVSEITGSAAINVLTYQDGTVKMEVTGLTDNGEPITVESTELTKGEDAQGRVTYTGKAVNNNNVTYDVVAVVYGDDAQPRIYMTLTTSTGYFYTIGENPDPDPNQVVANKTYTDNLTVGHDAQTGEVKGYADKQVVFTKYANGESTVTFKEYPISETETRDLTFRGTISETDMSEYGMGTVTSGEDMVMTPIEDETSAFYGKEISLFITISSYSAEKMEFTYEFGSEDGIYYVGQYGVEIEQPEIQKFIENWKSTSASGEKANVEIATASDGKVSMTVNVDDRTITADDLTQGKDEKDRVTYTGKAVDADMNEYDVKAVVYGAEDLQRIYMTLTNGEFVYTIGEDPDKEIVDPNEIVGSKTYTSNLSVDHNINLENEVVYENKQVKFDKYANGDVAVTFVAYPVSEDETCDLSFRGKFMENDMGPIGKFIYGDNLVCKVENEASSFNGQTLYLNINIKLKEDGSPTFSYTFYNNVDEENADAEKIYNTGRFNFDNVVNGINGIETEMENGNVSIYTVGGAKLNTLYKGINIVRLANGKTIKVIK